MNVAARRTAAAAAVAALTLCALAGPSASTPPGRNGLIAFVRHTYSSDVGAGIAVVRADGSGFRTLTRNGRDRSPAWSPDGRQIAFGRAGQIYVVRVNGTALHRLTRTRAGGRDPAWSPDGRSIAFVRAETVVVMRADGSRERVLFHRRDTWPDRPSWSPDGKWLAFGLSGEGEGGSIVVVSRTGGRLRYLTDGRPEPDENAQPGEWADDSGPDWSPDGTRVAFTRTVWLCPRCDQEALFSVAADGTDVRWLTVDTSYAAWRPAWSPDGNWIVADTSDGLALLTSAGDVGRILDRNGSDAAWQPLPKSR